MDHNHKLIDDPVLINFIKNHLTKRARKYLGIKTIYFGSNKNKYSIIKNNYVSLVGLLVNARDDWNDFDGSTLEIDLVRET